MSKYEFLISAQDATGRAFASINSKLGTLTKNSAVAAASIAGITASFAALTRRTVGNAQELDSLSQLAGESVEEFQALSYAFGMYNINAEKFADISKDVQDKLGDFLATGAGPFADFFENVAPQVGLTADALRDLSSTDVLIAVKQAMDDANVSAKEQVFYMEALANDATLLIPALKNGGSEIRRLADEYRGLNLAVTQTEVDKIKGLADEVARLESAATKLENKLTANLAEPLADVIDVLSDAYDSSVLRFERIFIGIDRSISAATLSWYEFQAAVGRDIDPSELQQLQGEIDYLDRQWQQLTDKINGTPIAYSLGYGETDDIFEGLDDPFDLSNAVTNVDVKPAAEEMKRTLLDSLSVADEFNAQLVDMNGMMQLSSEEFWTEYEQKGLNAYANLTGASEDFWDKLQGHIADSTENFETMWGNTFDRFTAGMAEATTAALFEQQSFGDALKVIARGAIQSIIQGLIEIGIQKMALFALEKTIGATGAATSAAMAATTGTAIATAYAPAAAMASLASYGANSIPAMGGIAATVGLSSSLALAGMAHDGIDDVPREGTWLLDKGERVVDSRTNKDLKNYLNSSNQQASNVSINAPITLGGDVSDEKILRTIERNPKRIARIINRLNGVPA